MVFDINAGKSIVLHRDGHEPETPTMTGNDGYLAELEYFLECIEQDKPPKTSTPQESREAIALALAERRSAQTGLPVTIS